MIGSITRGVLFYGSSIFAGVVLALAIPGCVDEDHKKPDIDRYHLPPTAVNIKELGNGWHLFDIEIHGRTYTFLHHYEYNDGAGQSSQMECLAEVHRQ